MITTNNTCEISEQLFDDDINRKIWQGILTEFGLTLSLNNYSQNYYGLDLKAQVRLVISQFSLAINPKILTSIYRYNSARYYEIQHNKKRAHFFK